MKKGFLISNLGTPDAPDPASVGRYLSEFLMDEDVIPLPKFVRWILVNLIIVPRRKFFSSKNYSKIWTEQGSPLFFHTKMLTNKLREEFRKTGDNESVVEFAMRYGNPSIESVLKKMKQEGVDSLTILPLYPQNSAATTGSTVKEVNRVLSQIEKFKEVRFIPEFFSNEKFIECFARVAEKSFKTENVDHIVMSFHGLPEKMEGSENYRRSCYETARLLSERLDIAPGKMTVAFQSRLGRAEWIKPYFDDVLKELATQSKKKITVFCPSFVADCLETLEEIEIGGRKTFIEPGGIEYSMVPSLNDNIDWVKTVKSLLQQ